MDRENTIKMIAEHARSGIEFANDVNNVEDLKDGCIEGFEAILSLCGVKYEEEI